LLLIFISFSRIQLFSHLYFLIRSVFSRFLLYRLIYHLRLLFVSNLLFLYIFPVFFFGMIQSFYITSSNIFFEPLIARAYLGRLFFRIIFRVIFRVIFLNKLISLYRVFLSYSIEHTFIETCLI